MNRGLPAPLLLDSNLELAVFALPGKRVRSNRSAPYSRLPPPGISSTAPLVSGVG